MKEIIIILKIATALLCYWAVSYLIPLSLNAPNHQFQTWLGCAISAAIVGIFFLVWAISDVIKLCK